MYIRIPKHALVVTALTLVWSCGGDTDEADTTPAPVCGGQLQCADDSGVDDLAMCIDAVDWLCIKGCCVEKKLCQTDADCAIELGTPACKDASLLCACRVETGQCLQSACGIDSDCSEGQLCNNGGCHDAPAVSSTTAHLLRPFWIARPKDSVVASAELGAQVRDVSGAVLPDATFEWTLKGDAFSLADGKISAGDKAGTATITASVKGASKASAPATLWNLGAAPADAVLRVSVADETDLSPVAGKVVVVGLADATTPAVAIVVDLVDGQAHFTKVEWPADIHIIGTAHEPVSLLRHTPADKASDLVLTARQYHYAALELTAEGELAPNAKLVNGDLLSGKVAYKGKGAAALGLTSLGVGTDLLSFNLDALIGPNVDRYFHPDTPSIFGDVDKPQELPGGATFEFGDKPVLDGYVLAAPPGNKILWSLAGRIDIDADPTLIPKIVESVAGDADIGKIVGALLPYLQGFYSQVAMNRQFADKPSSPLKTLDLAPSLPLLLETQIKPGVLPKSGNGWADLFLVVAGAMMPSGQLVPLGIAAGTDAANKKDVPDGKVDGDAGIEGDQPLSLTSAPLHSGLRVGAANFAIATAALVVAGGGKKEAGSIILSDVGPLKPEYSPGDFLPFPDGSSYGDASRALKIAPVAGAHFYRAILRGPESHNWQIVVAGEATDKELRLPDLTQWGAAVDAGADPKRAFIGAFELRTAGGIESVLAPGSITDLVRQTKRTSFVDVHE